AVRLRFHRPRDSDTLGLNRIEILGTSFYGPLPAIQPVLHSQKASLNWSRALDYCLRRSHSLSSLVLETLSNTEGILNVLLKILWTFPSSNLKSCVEFILIKFASSSTHVCTHLLNHLLYGGADLAGSLGVSHSSNSENELLYQLGIIQDDQTWERLKPLCEWLLYAEGQANMERPQSGNAGSNLIPKIRTTAAVIWLIKDDPVLCDHLQALITEEKFRRIYEWSQRVLDIPMLKLTLDHLICALCYVIRPYFQCLLNLSGPSIDQSEGKTNYSALTTLARASHSSPGAKDLLESTILQKVVENVEKSCRKFMKGSKKVSSSTQLSDKSSPNSLEALEKLLEFLTLCLGHHQLKDWLGSEEGSSFWQSLLSFLTDCHSRVSTRDPSRVFTRDTSRVSVCPRVLASLQTTSLRYFKTCVSGHLRNQQNLARVLFELLARESDDVKPKTLSGFLRRLVLELLLDDDHMTLAVTCSNITSQSVVTSPGNASQSPLWHPRFGTSNSCKLVSVRTNTKGQEILNTMVVNPLQQLQSLSSGVNDTAQKTSETLQDLAELFEFGDLSKHEAFTLTSSAFNVKHKRDKKKEEGTSNEGTGVNPNPDVKLPIENWLCCKDGPLAEIPLPKDITVSQIMQTVVEYGQGMGTICLRLDIRSPMDRNTSIPSEKSCDMISQKSVSTLLEVFSELGGLALIANHLPPRFSLDMSSDSNRTATSLYNPVVVTSLVPGYSLMGFTMFLRLPGYASILLENQQNACYMLRLILGVDDSGDG
ncbi:Baculoviral IAP repeat-containing 6, partial [Paramuricea clavata]